MKDFLVNDDEIKSFREKQTNKRKKESEKLCDLYLRVTQENSLWSFMTETSEKPRSTTITLQ